MKITKPIYDDSHENQLNTMICNVDENPIICTNPVEASSYMGYKMEGTEKGFHKYIKDNFFDTFISYIESYKNDCINAYAIKSDVVPIIKRVLAQYKDA
jgi:hypothetical protein